MKKAEKSFFTLAVCLVAALFIGLTAIASGTTTQPDAHLTDTITVINSSCYDLTNVRLVYNDDLLTATPVDTVNAGESVSVALPDTGVYMVQISAKTKTGKTVSGTFAGPITNSSFISVAIDESGELSATSNIIE